MEHSAERKTNGGDNVARALNFRLGWLMRMATSKRRDAARENLRTAAGRNSKATSGRPLRRSIYFADFGLMVLARRSRVPLLEGGQL